ncbi:NAD-dependent epimerase/dehydratase family protein [Streptomyces sp. NPDC056831]|uniref:NAD-dependent epimerase/dehydratase family protein n=1 Tax=Streptomyces sp. NPDC056831 TaxID=3345954 RepID=UPI0036D19F33
MQRICVIGGSRYFGRLLVERLQATGHQVTVINRGSTQPPAGVEHLAAGGAASPFSFDRHYAMSNTRAKQLGFAFSRTADRLPGAVAEALTASAAPVA